MSKKIKLNKTDLRIIEASVNAYERGVKELYGTENPDLLQAISETQRKITKKIQTYGQQTYC